MDGPYAGLDCITKGGGAERPQSFPASCFLSPVPCLLLLAFLIPSRSN